MNRGQKVVRSAKKNANEEYGLGRRVCAEKNPLQLTIVRKEKDSMPNRSKRADKSQGREKEGRRKRIKENRREIIESSGVAYTEVTRRKGT